VPWSKVFKYKGVTNVIDPDVFDRFYLNVDKSLFDVQMNSMKVEVQKSKDKQLLKDLGEKVNSTNKKTKQKDNNIKQKPQKNQNVKKEDIKKEVKKELNDTKSKNKEVKNNKDVKKASNKNNIKQQNKEEVKNSVKESKKEIKKVKEKKD